jgi:ribosomal-protein-alanine N-acetyltransferase
MNLLTARLTLVPCTLEILTAINECSPELDALLQASVPEDWPQENLREAVPLFINLIEQKSVDHSWLVWAIVLLKENTLIGDIGFRGSPTQDGAVELGYTVLPPYRNQGYATEAAKAMVAWALEQEGVSRVMAECPAENKASIRVLQKIGMKQVGTNGKMISWKIG